MKLSFVRVLEWPQAMKLRHVRNECRAFMTHDTHEITIQEQEQFFWKQLSVRQGVAPRHEAYLLLDDHKPIGYGMLYNDGEKIWMSMGLIEVARGKGLGTLICAFITALGRLQGEVWLEVWGNNHSALATYRKAGYRPVDALRVDLDVVHTMVCDGSMNNSWLQQMRQYAQGAI